MSVQPTSRGAQVAKRAEIAYYMTVAVALAIGILGAHGLLGHQLQNFMNHTANALPSTHWLALGASVILAPQVLKLAVKTDSATKGLTQEKALLAGRQRIQRASKEILAFGKNPPEKEEIMPDQLTLIGNDILTREATDAIIKLVLGTL